MEINKVVTFPKHVWLLSIVWDSATNVPACYWSHHEKGELTDEQCRGKIMYHPNGQTTYKYTPFDQAHFREVQALINQNAERKPENY